LGGQIRSAGDGTHDCDKRTSAWRGVEKREREGGRDERRRDDAGGGEERGVGRILERENERWIYIGVSQSATAQERGACARVGTTNNNNNNNIY
jgi:hypothetical protein